MAASATDVISLADAKLQLRIDGDEHDGLVQLALEAAVSYVSMVTRVPLRDAPGVTARRPPSRASERLLLPYNHLKSITEYSYRTSDVAFDAPRTGSVDVADLGALEAVPDGWGTHLHAPAAGWPTDIGAQGDAVLIRFVRGYDLGDGPNDETLRQAVVLAMRENYEQPNRERPSAAMEALLGRSVDYR